MVTYFIVNGSLTYVDPDGRATGYDDVFTRLAICADHFERVGLGREYVQKFVRWRTWLSSSWSPGALR